jgi:hypothetical protein
MHGDYQQPRHQRDTRTYAPVRLQIGYEIVL